MERGKGIEPCAVLRVSARIRIEREYLLAFFLAPAVLGQGANTQDFARRIFQFLGGLLRTSVV